MPARPCRRSVRQRVLRDLSRKWVSLPAQSRNELRKPRAVYGEPIRRNRFRTPSPKAGGRAAGRGRHGRLSARFPCPAGWRWRDREPAWREGARTPKSARASPVSPRATGTGSTRSSRFSMRCAFTDSRGHPGPAVRARVGDAWLQRPCGPIRCRALMPRCH